MKLCMLSLLTLILTNLFSCKKTEPIQVQEVIDTLSAPKFKNILVGEGSGDLIIDGSILALSCNDTIRISSGSYNSISIKNIKTEDNCNIVITNKGLVEFKGDFKQMNLKNLRGIKISGDGDPTIKYGFQFQDNVYRSVVISAPYSEVTLQYILFKNIRDYSISSVKNLEYDGTEDTYFKNIKFLNISAENTATFIKFVGSVSAAKMTGYVNGLEIANLDYQNSEVGDIVNCDNVENYDIHHNRISNINRFSIKHNGIFHISGNGKFHHNSISNHQGNALRAWLFTTGSIPKTLLIYNNIVVNSRKYSAFETQSFSRFINSSTTYANVMVYNNTCGNLNLSEDWYGNVVDVYDLQGGYCKVFNNLAFNFPSPNPKDNIGNQQSTTVPQISNNLYFNTAQEAGFSDQTTYTLTTGSPAKNKGSIVRSMLTDYYGNARSRMNPSIGAVE